MNIWMFVSYFLLGVSRFVAVFSTTSSTLDADYLINTRPDGTIARMMFYFTWFFLVPAFVLWSIVGTWWGAEVLVTKRDCMPSVLHSIFVVFWVLLSYALVAVYCGAGVIALTLERRMRKLEMDVRELEDDETVQRWGQSRPIDNYQSLAGAKNVQHCLSPAEIKALPGVEPHTSTSELDCSICLANIVVGDTTRCLQSCRHVFHRPCIDLWLLRSNLCPLCKHRVAGFDGAPSSA